MTEVRRTTFDELNGNPRFDSMVEEYAKESAIAGMPHPNRQVDMYQNMEKFGILYALGAFKDDELVGFALLTVTVVPHYGVKVGSTESIFVAVEHRKGGPGLRLLREAECWAKELGAVGMLVSSPYGAKLAEVLPKAGYKPSNQVFFKGLS